MAAQLIIDILPFDASNIQGIGRIVSGIQDTGAVTYDVQFTTTKLDGSVVPVYGRYIYVGVTGNLSYVKYNGVTETLPNIVAGIWHPIFAIRINTSGTTIAANMLRWGN